MSDLDNNDRMAIDSDEDFEDSDDSEIARELDERIRKAKEGGHKIFDDVSDCQSVMSMSNTMSNMNFLPLDTDLDGLIDQMLMVQNPV